MQFISKNDVIIPNALKGCNERLLQKKDSNLQIRDDQRHYSHYKIFYLEILYSTNNSVHLLEVYREILKILYNDFIINNRREIQLKFCSCVVSSLSYI